MPNQTKNIYVAATGQHVGKTTSTLGLAAVLKQQGYQVGYSKPVGQQAMEVEGLKVDKDALLFSDLLNFDIHPVLHSPVILDRGATARFMDDPEAFQLNEALLHAARILEQQYEVVIHEGTGHPGVGSIANVSNADVAALIGANVIMVVEGGIGNTIDRLNLCLPLFEERNVPVIGVIVNKVLPEKYDKVKHYIGRYLEQLGIPLLGVLPYDESLAYPLMGTVASVIKGDVVANPEQLDNKVEDILAGSLLEIEELRKFQNLLLVVSSQRVEEAIRKIESISRYLRLEKSPLSGIVATGPGLIEGHSKDYIERHKIPLVRTNLDTYGSVLKISRIEVKINSSTPWKVRRAIDLITENIDMSPILASTGLKR